MITFKQAMELHAKLSDNRYLHVLDGDQRELVVDLKDPVGQGTDGILFKAKYPSKNIDDVVVKFFVPQQQLQLGGKMSWLPSAEEDFEYRCLTERKHLQNIHHKNIQGLISYNRFVYDRPFFGDATSLIPAEEKSVFFIVSFYMPGRPLDQIINSATVSSESIIHYLTSIAEALNYLEGLDVRIIHGDIRAENIIIDERNNDPILIDFGLSKSFVANLTGTTKVEAGSLLGPEWLVGLFKRGRLTESAIQRKELGRILFPFLNLYQFGKLIEIILRKVSTFSDFQKAFLTYISTHLLDWRTDEKDKGTIQSFMGGDIKSASALLAILRRLYHRDFFTNKTIPFPRSHHGTFQNALLSAKFGPVVNHPGIRRLQNLYQLALVRYVFTSATQSRFDHCISTVSITREFISHFYSNEVFHFCMDAADIERLELAALIHDFNHYPFLHYFQEAGIDDLSRANIYDTILDYNWPNLADSSPIPTLQKQLEDFGITKNLLKFYFKDEKDDLEPRKPADQLIKSILNSGIDADKLAYLTDDSNFTGIPFGKGIDVTSIVEAFELGQAIIGSRKVWHTVFPISAMPKIENVCSARYWNFESIYWHEDNRALSAMILYTIRSIYRNGSGDWRQFITKTLTSGEAAAVEFLANEYERIKTGRHAPIKGLAASGSNIYACLFKYEGQFKNSFSERLRVLRQSIDYQDIVRAEIFSILKSHTETGIEYDESEVLLDIPGRVLDLGGPIFVRKEDGTIEEASRLSPILKAIEGRLNEMSNTVRIFVSPRLFSGLQGVEIGVNQLIHAIEEISLSPKITKNESS